MFSFMAMTCPPPVACPHKHIFWALRLSASAATRDRQGAANLSQAIRSELRDSLHEVSTRDNGDVVKGKSAIGGHSVIDAELHLGRDSADRSCRGNGEVGIEDGQRRLSGQEQMWAPARLWVFDPPDFSAIHQGSAATERFAEASAQGSSSAGGMRS